MADFSVDATSTAPRKRRRTSSDHAHDSVAPKPLGGPGKAPACSHCRRVKVKCGAAETGSGQCPRCIRLGLACLREIRSWASGAPENAAVDRWRSDRLASSYGCGNPGETQRTIVKLQRAVEDVLEKLGMPSLELYDHPAIAQPSAIRPDTLQLDNAAETAQAARRPTYAQRNVSPDPLHSLMEATELNGLRSQLRTSKLRRKGGLRRMDGDMISEHILSHEEAEAMLDCFRRTQSLHLYSATLPPDATLESIRSSSTVLFEAIMLVASLHIPGKERVHKVCHERFIALASAIMFDRFHALDDIRGLCIAAMWQADLSFKISGLGMRIATELNLQHAMYEAFSVSTTDEQSRSKQSEALEKARLWYLLYLLDHQSGVAYGRPPMKSALRPVKDIDILLGSQLCTPRDQELLAQVTGITILSRATDHFGLEPNRAMEGTDESILHHMRFTEELRAWMQRWNAADGSGLSRRVMLQYHFSDLVLHSLVLRGRPLDKLADLPASLRFLALKAVDAAHSILQHFLQNKTYRDEMVGLPFYLHAMIAFAVVFILKLSRRWHAIGITTDPQTVSWPLIKDIICLLRTCESGKNSTVYRMADGFERMLAQLVKSGKPTTTKAYQHQMSMSSEAASPGRVHSASENVSTPACVSEEARLAATAGPVYSESPDYGDWDFACEQPYDLLGAFGQGSLWDMDFTFE